MEPNLVYLHVTKARKRNRRWSDLWHSVWERLTEPFLPAWVMVVLLLGSLGVMGYAIYVSYLARLVLALCAGA